MTPLAAAHSTFVMETFNSTLSLQKQTTSACRADADRVFDKFDCNSSGALDSDEARKGIKKSETARVPYAGEQWNTIQRPFSVCKTSDMAIHSYAIPWSCWESAGQRHSKSWLEYWWQDFKRWVVSGLQKIWFNVPTFITASESYSHHKSIMHFLTRKSHQVCTPIQTIISHTHNVHTHIHARTHTRTHTHTHTHIP